MEIYGSMLWQSSLEPESLRASDQISRAQAISPVSRPPGLSQAGFARAFKVLDEAMITDVPIYGFEQPVISPGGYYRNGGWWEIDSALALAATKWTNETFSENGIRGFIDVQAANPDGRIQQGGFWPDIGSVSDSGYYPTIFEIAFDIARRTSDEKLRVQIYAMMRRFLDWWLSPVKRDARTGLVSSLFEETFSENDADLKPGAVAGVDTNVAVALGARRVSDLARAFGRILFNCAGIVPSGTVLECTLQEWSRAFSVNVTACFQLIQPFCRACWRRARVRSSTWPRSSRASKGAQSFLLRRDQGGGHRHHQVSRCGFREPRHSLQRHLSGHRRYALAPTAAQGDRRL